MTEEVFYQQRKKMEALLLQYSSKPDLSVGEKKSIDTLLEILKEYSFSNRLKMKGTMGRVMIDSLHIDYAFGEKVLQFDNGIS